MGEPERLDVDPRTLHLPPSRQSGADPVKLQRQIARFGRSIAGMPSVQVFRCSDGALVVYDGVTRATRVAKLLPGHMVTVEVIGGLRAQGAKQPTVGDRLT